ncbi:MAG: thioredoxin-disulfide reductase [Candidatus Diapherotrites archaeon]|nr:thioredoxin-disulfide reductase [Candidatus Diapherotrites archaeon]
MAAPFSFSLDSAVTSKAELKPEYDVVIIGGGPAGLAAAIYAARAKIRTAVLSKDFGGQVLDAHSVENYPGFVKATGEELMKKFREHAEHFGAELVQSTVQDIRKEGDRFVIVTGKGETRAPAVIYATGSTHRKLGVPGEEEFLGKGVSYCAICDAALFKDKAVAVVGGGNTAFMDADLLTQHAKKVYIIHRRNEFRAEPLWVERLQKNPKVEFITPYVVERIEGTDRVEKLVLRNRETGKTKELPVDGVFIDIGMIPQTELAKRVGVELNERGYIVVDEGQRTNVEGFFAAGDVTTGMNNVHQIITAAAKGAIAALSAYDYLKGKGFVK